MRESESVTVNIFGQDYILKGGADPAYVQKVASFVDERMHEVAQGSNRPPTVKVAILAAVNIADELLREQQKRLESVVDFEDRTVQLSRLLAKEVNADEA
ncbi:MAG: cell division protein ZapA [Candidatus Krumholzibacteriia bacterium]|jgi:cell division protein ZapA